VAGLTLYTPAGAVAGSRVVDMPAAPSGPPVFASGELDLDSNTTRDLAWARYGNLWAGQGTHDATYSRFIIDGSYFGANAQGNKPQMYGVDRITIRQASFINVKRPPPPNDHVEGIHLNGCRDLLFEDVYWSNNGVFHIFLTLWGGMHTPRNITLRRNRFDDFPGSFDVKVYDDANGKLAYPGVVLENCQFRGGPSLFLPAGATQTGSVTVGAGAWPAFSDGTQWTPVV
jgi:hypothetical protein